VLKNTRVSTTSLVVVLLFAARAFAHQSSVVYSQLAVDGRHVEGTFQLSDQDLAAPLGLAESERPTRAQVERSRKKLEAYLAERVTVTNEGHACEPEPGALSFLDKAEGFFAVVTLDWACKRTAADVRVKYDLFFDVDPRHQGLARVQLPGQPESQHVFRADARELALSQPVTLFDHVRDYLVLGIEHIFTGYDHLAFLFGLLVVAGFSSLRGGLRYVLGVVTAFTLAHSITLICSGLDLLRLPSRIVEPAIALSILYVAVENLVVPKPRFRWLLTFGFGLVHGFGFASVLREIGLPPRGLVLSLLSFNVGVELGQLAIVAAMAPLLWLLTAGRSSLAGIAALTALAAAVFLVLLRFGLPTVQLAIVVFGVPALWIATVPRFGYDRAVRIAGSIALAGLSSFWFLERVLEKSWLGGVLG
jgi:hypothetical protein